MLQVGNVLVSLDAVERFFCCDLSKCLGECCIEGDAGAPVTEEEYRKLKEILPLVWDDLLPAAQKVIEEQGVGYVDEDGARTPGGGDVERLAEGLGELVGGL